jgi:Putative transposase
MFEAASKTVLTLSRDKKRLGGTPALTMVLHTWTRDLRFHPHIHAIVSAGALNEQGQWVESRKDYLFPVKVMARLFRRFVREAMLDAIDNAQLKVPENSAAPMRRALFETAWLVYAKAPFGGAEQVFAYLGRYTHRVGISNARIQYADAHRVTFATKNGRTCTLKPVEFLRRFLLHVLPRGFHKIRHYGLCSTHHVAHGTLAELRDTLAAPSTALASCVAVGESADTGCQPSGSAPSPQTWVECLLALTGVDVLRCPKCAHGRLVARALDELVLVQQVRVDTS